MGVVIRATGVSDANDMSSIDNAVQAALRCLDGAGVDAGAVDLLINVGIYRDDNIMEPSIASLIQQRLEMNPDPVRDNLNARTFSFDLMNGACGFLNAVEVAAAMLQVGVYQNVLVVGGDVHPSRQALEGFPFSGVGGAALLGYAVDEATGFGPVRVQSRTQDSDIGYGCKGTLADFGESGRRHAVFEGQPGYQQHLCQHLIQAARRFMVEQQIASAEVDVLVTSQVEAGFPAQVAAGIELPASCRVIDIHSDLGDPHTAAPMICLHRLQQNGLLVPGQRVMFALVGSGFATSCALYRVPK